MIEIKPFGELNGKQVDVFTLKNEFLTVKILSLGAIINGIELKDKNGKVKDVVLGFDTIEKYTLCDAYLGAFIGRVCNRTEGAKFLLDGKEYSIGKNEKNNSLHGGFFGFDKKIFDYKIIGENLILSAFSKDGEEGYPGNLDFSVTYYLKDKSLVLEYYAKCDKDTAVNFTNHSYFNLSGGEENNIENTFLKINADYITPVNSELIAHGYKSVDGTPFDFRNTKRIGDDINKQDELLKICGGYDVNFVLKGEGLKLAAEAYDEKSGITLNVFTTEKGMQLYSGNFLNGLKGKNGAVYDKRYGFCLETQGFPNALNNADYPSIILKKGEEYSSKTIFSFGVK